jgi:serine/threonine protein kinase
VQTPQPDEARCGPYEILRELAQGVYTTVYEARNTYPPKLRDRRVTLKVLRHGGHAEHFRQAAMLNAFLEHPQVPALYDVGEATGQKYVARMYVEGDDLQNGIRSANRSVTEVTTIIAQVASALDYAHGRGIVHGYVHPRHMLLGGKAEAWLIGFGEYPPADAAALGNPLHLAPEQLEGYGALTPATDVFALSETALWLLSGRHPFEGIRATELLAAKRSGALCRPIKDLLPGISPAVEQVLRRGLAADPAARYANAGEFATALASAAHAGANARRWWFWR